MGAKHDSPDYRAARRHWEQRMATYGWTCRRCGQHIPPGDRKAWDLGHPDLEPEHAHCNRSAGAAEGNRARSGDTRWKL